MKEATKAMRRRWDERAVGESGVSWGEAFLGIGIDVGCGPDKIPLPGCQPFDKINGNAEELSKYVKANSLDYLHGSQVLEHMTDPVAALHDWLKCVKPGGFVVQTIPLWELYEGMVWPSRTNPDHRSTWSFWQPDSPAPIHCHLPKWLCQFPVQVLVCRIVDTNYSYKVGATRDQTFNEADGVEAFGEFVLRKK